MIPTKNPTNFSGGSIKNISLNQLIFIDVFDDILPFSVMNISKRSFRLTNKQYRRYTEKVVEISMKYVDFNESWFLKREDYVKLKINEQLEEMEVIQNKLFDIHHVAKIKEVNRENLKQELLIMKKRITKLKSRL